MRLSPRSPPARRRPAPAAAVPAAPASAQTPTACPVHVRRSCTTTASARSRSPPALHDHGHRPGALSCAAAADRFASSCRTSTACCPRRGALDAATTATFTGASGQGFSVARAARPAAAGREASRGRHALPGTFNVLHNDRSARSALPAGAYSITLLSIGRLSCAQASRAVHRVPAGLRRHACPAAGSSTPRPGRSCAALLVGFRVKPAGTPSGGGNRAGRPLRRRRVQHRRRRTASPASARAGRLPDLGPSSSACNTARSSSARLLDLRQGRLPRGWTLNPATATFTRRGTALFRLKLASLDAAGSRSGSAARRLRPGPGRRARAPCAAAA